MKKYLILFVLGISIQFSKSQEIISNKFISDPDNYPNSPDLIYNTIDSGYIILAERGKVAQSIIYKLDKNNEILWSYNFQSSKMMDSAFFLVNPIIHQIDNKFIYTAFWSGSIYFYWGYYYTFSLSNDGNQLSNYIKNDSIGLYYGNARFIPIDDKNYLAVGMDEYFNDKSIFIRKIDFEGNELWIKLFHDSLDAELRPAKVLINKNSDYSIFAQRSVPNEPRNILFLSCSPTGIELFRKVIDIDFYSLQDIFETGDGSYLILSIKKDTLGNYFSYLVKIDDKGNQIWEKNYSIKDFTICKSITQLKDKYYLAGEISEWDKFKLTQDTATVKSLLLAIDEYGSLIWQKIWDIDNMNYIQKLIINEKNNIVALGFSNDGLFLSEIRDLSTDIKDINIYSNRCILTPNPASDYIEISLHNGASSIASGKVQIFDILGIEVAQTPSSVFIGQTGASDLLRMDISHLPTGVYYIRIGDKVEKFVKM